MSQKIEAVVIKAEEYDRLAARIDTDPLAVVYELQRLFGSQADPKSRPAPMGDASVLANVKDIDRLQPSRLKVLKARRVALFGKGENQYEAFRALAKEMMREGSYLIVHTPEPRKLKVMREKPPAL